MKFVFGAFRPISRGVLLLVSGSVGGLCFLESMFFGWGGLESSKQMEHRLGDLGFSLVKI